MGRPPKPSHLRLIDGTRRKRPHEGMQLPVVTAVPKPPEWLPNARAVDEWKRLAPQLKACGLLTEGSLGAFAQMTALHGKIAEASSAGLPVPTALLAAWRLFASDFGLTPIAQGRVKVGAKPNGDDNPFDRFRR